MIDVVIVFAVPEDHDTNEPAGTVVHRMEIEGTVEQFLQALDSEAAMGDDAVERGEAEPGTRFRIVHDERMVGSA